MDAVAADLWSPILTTILGMVVIYIKYIHQLKTDVAELKGFCEIYRKNAEDASDAADTLKLDVAVLKKTVEEQQKTLESITKRMDSHSKKQDEILDSISKLKIEMIQQLGFVTSDLKNINRLLTISDNGISFSKQ